MYLQNLVDIVLGKIN